MQPFMHGFQCVLYLAFTTFPILPLLLHGNNMLFYFRGFGLDSHKNVFKVNAQQSKTNICNIQS